MSLGTQVSLSDLISGALTGNALSHMILSTGLVDGVKLVNIQGLNQSVSSTGGDQIIGEPGGVFTFPLTAAPVLINYAGTGNFAVKIEGLDANWNQIEEIVPFTTGATNSTLDFFRINSLTIVTPGTRTAVVSLSISGVNLIDIATETIRKRTMTYTVPDGYVASVAQTSAGVGKNEDADIVFRFHLWTPGGYLDDVGARLPLYQSSVDIEFNSAFLNSNAPGRTDILLECNTSSNGTRVSAFNSIIIMRDDVMAKLVSQIKI